MLDTSSFRIRWAIPVPKPPREDVFVRIEQGRLVELTAYSGQRIERDYGDAVLVPKLCNAHTHLELTSQRSLRPARRPRFSDWLDQVISLRRAERAREPAAAMQTRREAIQTGLRESLAAGTSWIGDIVSTPPSDVASSYDMVSGIAFVEFIGLTRDRLPVVEQAVNELGQMPPALSGSWTIGLSPHAPYSVAPRLIEQICHLAELSRRPIAMHLAESREESQLLADGSGPLVEVLSRHEAWEAGVIPSGALYRDYLRALSAAPRSLVIHGTYLDPPDWDFLAAHRDTMAVVYCPRTHAQFDHRPYRLAGMLAAGVRVVIGTDSLATNPDLDPWRELAFCRNAHPSVEPSRILAMATSDVWRWRGVERSDGLASRAASDFSIRSLPDANDPWSFMTCAEGSR